MSFADEAVAVRQRFAANWLETAIAWPNTTFTPSQTEEWVRLTILPAAALEAALGGARYRYIGQAIVQVFVPKNTGDGRALELADAACGIFRGVTADGIRYTGPLGEVPGVRVIGDDGNGFFQVNCVIPFWRDETS